MKKYRFTYESCEVLDAPFDRAAAQNKLLASTNLLSGVVKHISVAKVDEVLLRIDPRSGIWVRSIQVLQAATSKRKSATGNSGLQTDIHVHKNDFDLYEISPDEVTELTFSLREFKALLQVRI